MKYARLALCVAAAGFAAAARAQEEDPTSRVDDARYRKRTTDYAYSALGPDQDRGALAAGLKLFISKKKMIVPMLTVDLLYTRNLTEAFDLEVHLSTLVVGTIVEAGARFKIVADESFSFALRGAAAAGLALGSETRGTAGATPGLLASFGTDFIQVTAAFDVALLSHGGLSTMTPNVLLRPSVTLEGPIDEGTNLFVQFQSWVTADGQAFIPAFSLGGSF